MSAPEDTVPVSLSASVDPSTFGSDSKDEGFLAGRQRDVSDFRRLTITDLLDEISSLLTILPRVSMTNIRLGRL